MFNHFIDCITTSIFYSVNINTLPEKREKNVSHKHNKIKSKYGNQISLPHIKSFGRGLSLK